MKTYKFEVTIREGNDEYWEEITAGGRTGVDDVQMWLFDMMAQESVDVELTDIKLIGYTDE
jgi:hypothetical protein